MSIAGGVSRAVERALRVEATALQVFTANQVRWQGKPIPAEDAARFRDAVAGSALRYVCAHASYLPNPATADPDLRARSRETLIEECRRAHALGCDCVVLHPGSPGRSDDEAAIPRTAAFLAEVLAATAETPVSLALENTAGQGHVLGRTFAEIGALIRACGEDARLRLCLDTAHAFAAGYDWREPGSAARIAAEIDREVGIGRLCVLHLNDSKTPAGSRTDRHEHIGRGMIGKKAFAEVLATPLLAGIPGIIETPKDPDTLEEDRANLRVLRALGRRPGASRAGAGKG